MKAIVYTKYGSPEMLEYKDIEKPTPEQEEVLVRVHAASVNWLDWHFLTGTPLLTRFMAGLFKPKNKVLGIDVAGKVEAVGANVELFKPGDEVFGSTTHGCFAEYACVGEDQLQLRPAKMTFEQVAAVPAAAVTALHGLRDHGKIQPGQRVLINGASGGVGTFAVQLAKAFGTQVTGVCSTRNLDMVRSIGADHVIDYTQQDFTRAEQRYDLIFDVVAKRSFSECKLALSDAGIYVTTEFSPVIALYGQWSSMTGSKKMVPLTPRPPSKNDLGFLRKQLDEGKLIPVIDRCYSLNEVPAALNYLADGHARGKIVIKQP